MVLDLSPSLDFGTAACEKRDLAIAALAADPDVSAKSGGLFSSWGLSEEYGFADVDGRRPHWRRDFAKHLEEHHYGEANTRFHWELVPAG